MNAAAKMTYSLAEVKAVVGITRSQAQHWIRSGVVRPAVASTGTGDHREFNFLNLVQFALAKRLEVALAAPALTEVVARYATLQRLREARDGERSILRIRFGGADGLDDGLADRLGRELRQVLDPEPFFSTWEELRERLDCDDQTVLAINVARLIAQLEKATWDRL